MISRIKGTLVEIQDQFALVENRGLFYEVRLPSALAERLKENGNIGESIQFETLYYIEAGDKKSSHYPRMVGFTSPVDRAFFSMLIQVPGLGVKKALKSLVLPIRDIATAIENKDAGALNRLPGVGGRLAEKIIAELHGKTAKFALSQDDRPLAVKKSFSVPFADEAREVLLQLQYNRQEVDRMIDEAIKAEPGVSKVEDLISVVFKNERADGAKV